MSWKKRIILFMIMAISVIGFAFVAYEVKTGATVSFDSMIDNAFYSIRNPDFNIVIEGITYLGNWESITIVCLLLLAYPHLDKTWGLPVTGVAVATQIVKAVFKPIIARPRPDISLHLISQGGYSFPSGHAITTMAVYGLLFFIIKDNMENRKKKILLMILTGFLAFAVGLSRIYLGVHFATDVLGGWLAAVAVIVGAMLITDSVKGWLASRPKKLSD